MVTDRHLKNQWNGRQCRLFESPAEASPWSCDVDRVVDNIGVFGGIAIGFASFGTSIG